jgi:glycosyltransferase involved in cell wall biosynthesis
MISVGLDVSAIDPSFKSHAQRGIGRYVTELQRFFDSVSDPDVRVGHFDHASLARDALVDKAVGLIPFGRTSVRQHVLYPSRLHSGVVGDFSLLHYPAHMDAPARSSRPYVLTVLDLIPHVLKSLYQANKPGWRFKLARWLEVLSIRQATLLLAISETTANDLVRVLNIPRERIVVTPLGVDKSFFEVGRRRRQRTQVQRDELRASLGIPLGRPIVLYVGGHDERKNIGVLVAVMRRVIDEAVSRGKEKPVLVLAGRVSTMEEQRRLSTILQSHDMERDTVSLGYVQDAELKDLYAESELFLFPSLYEGFGLPALEAMAAGVPVVASNASSLPEVVGDAGILFDPLQVDDGVRGVVQVLFESGVSERLSIEGELRARGFTWEQTGRLTLGGYKQAAELLTSTTRARGHRSCDAPLFDESRV